MVCVWVWAAVACGAVLSYAVLCCWLCVWVLVFLHRHSVGGPERRSTGGGDWGELRAFSQWSRMGLREVRDNADGERVAVEVCACAG